MPEARLNSLIRILLCTAGVLMQFKNIAIVFSAATVACSVLLLSEKQQAFAKSKNQSANSRRHQSSNYFVPPPPAYVPAILPERMMYGDSSSADAGEETANPYSKYIYTRQGYSAPRAVQSNKYITYWNKN